MIFRGNNSTLLTNYKKLLLTHKRTEPTLLLGKLQKFEFIPTCITIKNNDMILSITFYTYNDCGSTMLEYLKPEQLLRSNHACFLTEITKEVPNGIILIVCATRRNIIFLDFPPSSLNISYFRLITHYSVFVK